MKTCFISGPITGHDDYQEYFGDAVDFVQHSLGYIPVSPVEISNPIMEQGLDLTWDQWMKIDLAYLDFCDCIFMLKGWETSKGATQEHAYALEHGKKIIYETSLSEADV